MQNKFTVLTIALLSFGTLTAQTWEQKTSNPGDGRHHPVTFSLDGKGYMVTGSTDFTTGTTDFYEYDPVADSWTTLQNFYGLGRGYSIGDTWAGKAYMGFGFGATGNYLKDLWEYDPTTGNWTELAACPCAERIHPAFVIEDGLLFVGLGNNDVDGNLNDWWEYNIATDTWRQLTDLPGPPRHHPYMFSANGDVYTGLGHSSGPGTNVQQDWYKWDITAETWTPLNDLPAEGRVAGTQFSIGDRGFILSGDGDNHGAMQTGEFWEYDYQNDSWTELPPHPSVSRWAPGSFTIGNVVYFTAGEVRPGNPNAGLKADLWSFDLDAIANVPSEDQFAEVVLYPNPTTSSIQLKGISAEDDVQLSIINSTGQTVLKPDYTNDNINLAHLNAGFYYLTLQKDETFVKRIKFVKQ
jgi:N-acetylneuraminic acid mutarotase